MRKWRRRWKILFLAVVVVALAFGWRSVYNIFMRAAYPDKYREYVTTFSQRSNIEPSLVFAVIKTESSFNPNAVSNIGAIGLMQVTPPTFEWMMRKSKETNNYTSSDLYTPEVNIRYGTAILSELKREFGDERVALAAYHAGRSNVMKWLKDKNCSADGKTLYYIPFPSTRAYIAKVEKIKVIYEKLYYSQ